MAETLGLEVEKKFFIDLKLPYSAVRHEQIEIKAIIHNNNDEPLKVSRSFFLKYTHFGVSFLVAFICRNVVENRVE